uniref:platelet-activating factor acetylhydrolase isoform X2 n=1 Tax=Doryrhamphus excisus TaxID=161450 RepID=UPI0025AE966D|nr:platelet-activating factor acetylhydrolase isoform X2 [Doryrhamphus excisus]
MFFRCLVVTSLRYLDRCHNNQRRYKLGLSAMGNAFCNNLHIPSPKGPNAVGCTDFMMDHTVQGSFFRLYYPCERMDKAEMPDWIPSREYFNGLADFMKINRTFSERIFNFLFGSFKIPADLDAPFRSSEKCPVVIFSHGLGAFRDLSASATYHYREKNPTKASSPDNLVREWIYYRTLQQGEQEFPIRNQQVNQRADECVRALDRLTDINSGLPVQNVLQTHFDWTTLQNSMDLGKVAVMGHSFGGATAIEALAKDTKFKCAVALDAWMLPLRDDTFCQIKQPIFFINSEKFQWAENIKCIQKLDSCDTQRKMMTIRGTVHQAFPDFTFLTGDFIGKLMKLKSDIDPEMAINLSNKATLAFLQRHLGLEKDFNQWDPLIEGDDENLIPGTNVTLLQSAM